MPELPEVETVRQGLLRHLQLPCQILAVELGKLPLRRPLCPELATKPVGSQLLDIERRAKYLLWRCSNGWIINHLGMSGAWRFADDNPRRHDHCRLLLDDGRILIYSDPRRFGLLGWYDRDPRHSLDNLRRLGPEPWDPHLTPSSLRAQLQRRKGPIKAAIMDQRLLVGVGNIYASEALFRAGIRPQTPAMRLGAQRCARLLDCIRSVLNEAIAAGGSTIRDFRQAGGSSGYFQHRFQVYGREGEACHTCDSQIRSCIIGGRSTFWCPRCQH
ncbi:MAG: bifunctional DNA-formamidopyrimidine glycosylase/DNA-(apurinic or apyrimidinic site) lyase [Planctomycetota bacterium]|nr:MAG: bifunctional DNA-formamidopyrimidine glycosylase/DNA-(apurinic or apyrimidinic site) lyase [Planctomycetota bacterium]